MRVLITDWGRAMKSFFALTWAVCLSVCFVLIPSSAFAAVLRPVYGSDNCMTRATAGLRATYP